MKKRIYLFSVFLILVLIIFNIHAGEKPKNIMFLFDIKDYPKEIDYAIDSFFNKALGPKDQLIIMTPANKMLSYSSQALSESRKKINQEVKDTIKKHTSLSGASYRNIYTQMLSIVEEIRRNSGSQDVKNLIAAYENNRNELRMTRRINQELLLNFADVFKRSKKVTGDTENQMYLFFQKEYRPIPDKDTMDILRENQQIAFKVVEVFLEERSKTDFGSEKIGEELKKAEVQFNFVYINPKKVSTKRYQLIDNSGDLYSAMSKIVEITGGEKVTTTTPKTIFERH
ncbi:MAG: hypothetical protein ACLFVG_05385 [Candidatus Aminicenantes bacterium]